MPIFKPGPTSDHDLRAQFSWLARSGIGRHFGTLPIGWYQQHQMCALGLIESRAVEKLRLLAWSPKDQPGKRYSSEPFEVRMDRAGRVSARRQHAGKRDWASIGDRNELFREADRCARGGW